jgi:hypothetical protein
MDAVRALMIWSLSKNPSARNQALTCELLGDISIQTWTMAFKVFFL